MKMSVNGINQIMPLQQIIAQRLHIITGSHLLNLWHKAPVVCQFNRVKTYLPTVHNHMGTLIICCE